MSAIEVDQPKVPERERKKNQLLQQFQESLKALLAQGTAGDSKLGELLDSIRPPW